MTLLIAIFLGILQGLTEFLPISSSGHLVLVQQIIPGFYQQGVLFDVILHIGTLAAVLYFFRKKIFSLTPKYLSLLLVGTVPAVIMIFFFRQQLEGLYSNDRFLGIEFVITGLMNLAVDLPQANKELLKIKSSFLIGIAQALAIFPAISRSGATIFTGVRMGIDKKEVVEYSFILSIPVIFGAGLIEILTFRSSISSASTLSYLVGFLTSFIVGFFAIAVVVKFLQKRWFKYFGYYCIGLGVLTFFFN
ncbi:hypothetical protein A2Z22_01290 [Candidatus Woesebacteria bacterium RBG_16_34_12]|uniref:Undecaprenyl-diphosphatase n=1 Tax=Candidatus Woesebacteria bacterium RBG_16_34_12 TaxID=1802480 RepID=A0A1F7X8N6_9BACT|nr:MAG: hypothetical protein A2Z22_01290 [Candidatus Woesebacteria bacterium RBG_16_34_12]